MALGDLSRAVVGRSFGTNAGRRVLRAALRDPRVLAATLNGLSDQIARTSSMQGAIAPDCERISGFEDLVGLFSSNVLNHGASRMMVDEAAYLYRLVGSLDTPRVAEIGRYHGGTCLLLAAAGATVTSIDVDESLGEADRQLAVILTRLGLLDRVELHIADSRTFPYEQASYDVVFVDGDHSYEGVKADVTHWWGALRPGGSFVLHDAKRPVPPRPWADPWKIEGSCSYGAELVARADVRQVEAPGTLVHVVRRT